MKSKSFVCFILLLLFCACTIFADENDVIAIKRFAGIENAKVIENIKPYRNLVMMIGDGMGNEQVTAARIAAFGRGMGLEMDLMPVIGQSITCSMSNEYITDSAAGATALATGIKTLNSRIGKDAEGVELSTVLDVARKLGKSTGVVTLCDITDATPAAFLSHVKTRSNYWEIARQMSVDPPEVLLGGGYRWFMPGRYPESNRDDELNLLDGLVQRGYTVITSPDSFAILDYGTTSRLFGLFSRSSMPPAERRKPSLQQMVKAALDILSRNPNGFFLMIEGSHIDAAGHANDMQMSVGETLDFDKTVGLVRQFSEEDGSTLMIVTADHETGGLSITSVNEEKMTLTGSWATRGHTANLVPVCAFGPNAEVFGGLHQNIHIPQLAVQGWGITNFSSFAYDKSYSVK